MQGQAGGQEDLREKRRHFHGLFIWACSMRYRELSDAERRYTHSTHDEPMVSDWESWIRPGRVAETRENRL